MWHLANAPFAAESPDGRSANTRRCLEKRPYYQGEPSSDSGPRHTYCCPNNSRRCSRVDLLLACFTAEKGKIPHPQLAQSPQLTSLRSKISLTKELAIDVRQQTDYPNSGRVVLHIDPQRPAEFSLKRIPRWCYRASIKLNGQVAEGNRPAGNLSTSTLKPVNARAIGSRWSLKCRCRSARFRPRRAARESGCHARPLPCSTRGILTGKNAATRAIVKVSTRCDWT